MAKKLIIVPDLEETFGSINFLGYEEKMKYDRETRQRTDELEGYVCYFGSGKLGGQVEVTVPPMVAVQDIEYLQKVTLEGVEIDYYGRSAQDSTFAEVILRCTAKNILNASGVKPPIGGKPNHDNKENK